MGKVLAIVPVILLASGCRSTPSVAALSDEFVYRTLAFSPSSATAIGLHQYEGQNLDNELDDMSNAAVDRQRRFYADFQKRLSAVRRDRLAPEDAADLGILEDQTALALLDLNHIHSHLHNPTLYVETLGNALFTPSVLEYAPKPKRIGNIISRLQKVPLFLDQANTNLVSSPKIWTQVAIEENQGNIDLVDKTIRAEVPSDQRAAYDKAAQGALAAMRKFQNYLQTRLTYSDSANWRLGKDLYTQKFKYALESGMDPETTLSNAEADMVKVRARMYDLALPIERSLSPRHNQHADLSGDARQNEVIGEVLNHIAERHSTRESYMEDARKDLDEARAFVESKHLLTLPARKNLQVIPTPPFMRGIYSVGGFNPAPALEPQLGAFYWVTPIPPDWPAERAESKLREYNFYKLKLLTIHEAMPGHYVQMEVANDVQPKSRRVLRSVFGNGPYIEGWAQYATQMMLDEGFLEHSPEMALTFAKEELRVLANAILDVRLQMLDMTDQDALTLMEKQAFQEKEEAEGKLRRAKLSSCQLPMYFLGWRGWLRVRDEYKQKKGSSYSLAGFNNAALEQGAVPLPVLGRLLK
jgi:uncharacterized protein (DUF885 family)